MRVVQVFTCRTLRIGWGLHFRLAATMAAFVGCFALLNEEAWGSWRLLVSLCMLAAATRLMLWEGRSLRGHVLELAGDSVRIRPGEGRRQRLPVRREITPQSIADGYALTPSHLVLTLRSGATGATIDAELDGDGAQKVLDHLGVTRAPRALRTPVTYGWLETGLDGVRIATPMRSRFIPYGNIEKVTLMRKRIVIETTSGRVQTPDIADTRAIPTLVSRIEERRAAAALAHAPPLDLLDRRERPIADWRAALGELSLGGKGFRGAALHDDDLQRILDDPGLPLEQRIGAALALRSRSGDARARIRVAAETSVERRVRVALEAAAADDIDDRAIERALGEPEPLRTVAAREPHKSED